MKKIYQTPLLCFLFCVLFSQKAVSQDPISFSQFWLNPYQFNPSYVAQNGHSEANLLYRQQWLGIENAPVAGTFNIQSPFGKNVSLGLSIASSKTILLNSTSILPTFGYRVRLGYYHHLNFGLSAGILLNKFDLNAAGNSFDPALANFDPALANIIQSGKYAAGQAGINYQHKHLNIGFSLPYLFDSRPNSPDEFPAPKFNPFLSKFGSVSYAFHFRDIQLSPTVLYRALDGQQDQWEVMAVATYKTMFWIGTSYRDGYGITGFIGLKLNGAGLKNVFRFGYAYEHPTGSISKASSGTHELFAGLKFGKRDRELEFLAAKKTKDSLAQIAKASELEKERLAAIAKQHKKPIEPVHKEVKVKHKPDSVTPKPDSVVVVKEEPQKEQEQEIKKEEVIEQPTEVVKEAKEEVLTGYYVVVGAFKSQKNALKEISDLNERGLYPEFVYILKKDYYYVFTLHTENRQAAFKEHKKIRINYPRAWIFAPADKDFQHPQR